ncbi:MAG: transcription-repair coupling factor [Eubacteriales bacterium]|nr:transcription-repair coupling factor [Eubacteriales bacterium]
MKFLCDMSLKSKDFKRLDKALKKDRCVAVSGLTPIHKAHTIYSLCISRKCRAFCVASDEREATLMSEDLTSMGLSVGVYPYRDFNFRNLEGYSREYEHQRLSVLTGIISGELDCVIACVDAAVQYTVPVESLKSATLSLKVGESVTLEKCTEALTLLGYERCDQIEGVGQYSVRGGILDFFSPDSEYPVRVEFWGDEVDSVSYFDLSTQRRTENTQEIVLSPSTEVYIKDREELAGKIEKKAGLLRSESTAKAKEILLSEAEDIRNGVHLSSIDKYIGLVYEETATLIDYIDDSFLCFISEESTVEEKLKSSIFRYKEDMADYFAEGILCRGFETFSIDYTSLLEKLQSNGVVYLDNFTHGSHQLPLSDFISFSAKQLPALSGTIGDFCEELKGIDFSKSIVVLLCYTEKAAANIASVLCEKGFPAKVCKEDELLNFGKINVFAGTLSYGMEYSRDNFYIFTQGKHDLPKKQKRKLSKNAQQIYSLSDLAVGDYVVHTTHGIGIFEGINKIDTHGIVKDYIKISYAKGDALYVPVTQLDLVAKYIGPRENSSVKLSRLGGGDWQKAKTRVKSAVKDMAKELMALYSARMNAEGFAFSGDGEWQRDFEMGFEYEETPDQLRCVEEIKADMQRKAPMDRLLCGDVGFGKTEVALRAAFKCICDSKQCALLCPTTILAWQHYQTILKRFETYPVRVELLSRFRKPAERKAIIEKLKRGEIDMVVGTHRLVQKDVEFRDLGLVIIDEEQRFGVAHKERLKELYKNIDVLTLSATPIPRTLNMALSGIRDLSVLEEAPENRFPVQTYVLEHETGIINDAIRKELRRGGQVFYLHNNVDTIAGKAARIQQDIPEAQVGIGHGKMSESELSAVWRDMIEQKINVLVCTTIIETGVDVPNANTLIIENADKFGLSQLHQLRGRVGRSNRRAFAYLTFTRGKVLSEISQKRLTAIREFTEFGSGMKIAMRDLELRGAGSVLGGSQHGHMEDVGYDMYLKLLDSAVREERGEAVSQHEEKDCLIDIAVVSHIPESYIESLSLRLDVYKLIADIKTSEDASDVIDELLDRFGDIPKSVMGLIDIALIRNRAASMGIYEIKQNENNLLLYVKDIKNPDVVALVSAHLGDALLSAGNKPYISYRMKQKHEPLSALKELFSEKSDN